MLSLTTNNRWVIIFLVILTGCLTCSAAANDFADRGISHFRAEDYEEASQDLMKAYQLTPRDAAVVAHLGYTLKEMQDYVQAARYLKEARLLNPSDTSLAFTYAEVLYMLARYDESLATLETLPDAGRNSAQVQYLKGLILLKQKKTAPAVAALSQSAILDASMRQQADYHIAAAYVQDRDYSKASSLFATIVRSNPDSSWASFSKEYLEALEKVPPRYRLIAGAALQYDDNVLAVPRDQRLVDVEKKGDWKRIFSLYGEYAFIQKAGFDLKGSYALGVTQHFRNHYDKTTPGETIFSQDTLSHTFTVSPTWSTQTTAFSLLLSYNLISVDYTSYAQTFTLNPSLTFTIAQNQLGQVALAYKKYDQNLSWSIKKFGAPPAEDEDRDADNVSISFDYYYLLAKGKGLINLRLEAENNSADGQNWDYNAFKIAAGVSYPLIRDTLKAGVYSEIYFQRFTRSNSFYEVKRRDTTLLIQPSVTCSIIKPLDLILSYAHINDHSNIDVYKYSRNLYTLGIEYRF